MGIEEFHLELKYEIIDPIVNVELPFHIYFNDVTNPSTDDTIFDTSSTAVEDVDIDQGVYGIRLYRLPLPTLHLLFPFSMYKDPTFVSGLAATISAWFT